MEVRVMGNPSALAGFLLLLGVASSSPASGEPALVNGAYQRLSASNQQVARALFDAQTLVPRPGATRDQRTLTLDEIAAKRQGGQPWGQVFQAMRIRGLLQESNLRQVMSRYEQQATASVSPGAPRGKTVSR
jgi:hypothetical protein